MHRITISVVVTATIMLMTPPAMANDAAGLAIMNAVRAAEDKLDNPKPTDCIPFDDGQRLTLSGNASSWTGEGEGGAIETDIVFELDTPICPNGYSGGNVTSIEIYPPPKDGIPGHMTITGCLNSGLGWSIDTECTQSQ